MSKYGKVKQESNSKLAVDGIFIVWFLAISVLLFAACSQMKKSGTISEKKFGTTKDGLPVSIFELTNASGMIVKIIDYGATVTSILVPDRNGEIGDVVFGHDDMLGYEEENDYFGCVVGRYANRIAKGKFIIDGLEYQLALNNGPNTLHGGWIGFDKKVWKSSTFKTADSVGVVMTYLSVDGEEGYPGNLNCQVTYSLNNRNELFMSYEGLTDAPTVVNLCNHTYFNLKDGGASSILDHEMQLMASTYTPVDSTLIPTGQLPSVEGTPFDFRSPVAIGARIDKEHQQLIYGLGYDHNFVLDKKEGELSIAARVHEPGSGRVLEIFTTEPGIQFYSGNFLKGNFTGKNDITYQHRSGFALETQHFPDSPNQPDFPSVLLNPGEKYKSISIFKFGVNQ